ncbi:hypothetical protein PCE1_002876 [Barthelona sp. PCE]
MVRKKTVAKSIDLSLLTAIRWGFDILDNFMHLSASGTLFVELSQLIQAYWSECADIIELLDDVSNFRANNPEVIEFLCDGKFYFLVFHAIVRDNLKKSPETNTESFFELMLEHLASHDITVPNLGMFCESSGHRTTERTLVGGGKRQKCGCVLPRGIPLHKALHSRKPFFPLCHYSLLFAMSSRYVAFCSQNIHQICRVIDKVIQLDVVTVGTDPDDYTLNGALSMWAFVTLQTFATFLDTNNADEDFLNMNFSVFDEIFTGLEYCIDGNMFTPMLCLLFMLYYEDSYHEVDYKISDIDIRPFQTSSKKENLEKLQSFDFFQYFLIADPIQFDIEYRYISPFLETSLFLKFLIAEHRPWHMRRFNVHNLIVERSEEDSTTECRLDSATSQSETPIEIHSNTEQPYDDDDVLSEFDEQIEAINSKRISTIHRTPSRECSVVSEDIEGGLPPLRSTRRLEFESATINSLVLDEIAPHRSASTDTVEEVEEVQCTPEEVTPLVAIDEEDTFDLLSSDMITPTQGFVAIDPDTPDKLSVKKRTLIKRSLDLQEQARKATEPLFSDWKQETERLIDSANNQFKDILVSPTASPTPPSSRKNVLIEEEELLKRSIALVNDVLKEASASEVIAVTEQLKEEDEGEEEDLSESEEEELSESEEEEVNSIEDEEFDDIPSDTRHYFISDSEHDALDSLLNEPVNEEEIPMEEEPVIKPAKVRPVTSGDLLSRSMMMNVPAQLKEQMSDHSDVQSMLRLFLNQITDLQAEKKELEARLLEKERMDIVKEQTDLFVLSDTEFVHKETPPPSNIPRIDLEETNVSEESDHYQEEDSELDSFLERNPLMGSIDNTDERDLVEKHKTVSESLLKQSVELAKKLESLIDVDIGLEEEFEVSTTESEPEHIDAVEFEPQVTTVQQPSVDVQRPIIHRPAQRPIIQRPSVAEIKQPTPVAESQQEVSDIEDSIISVLSETIEEGIGRYNTLPKPKVEIMLSETPDRINRVPSDVHVHLTSLPLEDDAFVTVSTVFSESQKRSEELEYLRKKDNGVAFEVDFISPENTARPTHFSTTSEQSNSASARRMRMPTFPPDVGTDDIDDESEVLRRVEPNVFVPPTVPKVTVVEQVIKNPEKQRQKRRMHLPTMPKRTKKKLTLNAQSSNLQRIRNAIRFLCLAGEPNKIVREEVLAILDAKEYDYYIVMLSDAEMKRFRGLYCMVTEINGDIQVRKLYGKGPSIMAEKQLRQLYKYDTSRRMWKTLTTEMFSINTDAAIVRMKRRRRRN